MTSLISRIQFHAVARRKILLPNLAVKSQVPATVLLILHDGALQTGLIVRILLHRTFPPSHARKTERTVI